MRRLLFCAALVWLASSGASGQEQSGATPRRDDAPSFARREDASAEAARLLRSRGNRGRAWGAYLAGAYDLKEHAALLVALLEDPDVASGGWEESHLRRAALDALIRLDAEVPAETLLPLYTHAPDEVFILLARAPERNASALLSFFKEETPGALWVGVANLLAEARARGFAARLLAGLKMEATVYVYDREGDRGYNGGYGYGCGGGRGGFESPPGGFPPAGFYALTARRTRGAVLVADGPRAVFYLRGGPEHRYAPDYGCEVERDSYRVESLAGLLRTTAEDLGLESRALHGVVCREAPECRRALAALRDETARTYADVLTRLQAAGLLDPAEASDLKPDLTLKLYDGRDAKTFRLPDKIDGVKILPAGGDADADDDAPSSDAPR